MAENRKHYTIFVASPSDVAEEREIARTVISEVNRNLKTIRHVSIEACGWEELPPGLGRPQALINPLVQKADLLIGILWKRFGTSTGVAESGTKEEFDIMYKRWQAKEPVNVMMYFRDVPGEMLADSGPQLLKVLEFQQEFKRLGLYRAYERPQQFAEMLRQHLMDWIGTRRTGPPRNKGASKERARAYADVTRTEQMTRFLNSQVEEHKYLKMTGFETRIRQAIELQLVLVPVRARSTEYSEHAQERGLSGDELEASRTSGETSVIDFEQAWRDAQLKKLNTLIVLGQPGSGKTTLLRHLLLRCISNHKELGFSRPTIPLLLPLRLVDPVESLGKAIQGILKTDQMGLPAKFFDGDLRAGNVLLLLDGLDEVASASARERITRWVQKQRKRFPDCPIVVTSRFAGYAGSARLQSYHIVLALERFSKDEIRAFLERWCVTVETTLGGQSEFFRQRGREAAANLADRIIGTPELFDLATNPLMLQIIGLVHRDRGTLPERRVELYDECTNVLLEHWDRAKGGIDIPLTAREARGVLEPVAHWMHQVPERRYASASMLLPILRKELAKFPKRNVKAREFLDNVRDRSGLFVGHGVDEYGFQHLSFQEYLAANQVPQGNHLKGLVSRYGETWWQEVTRLLVGLHKPNCFEPFMRLLVSSERFLNNHSLTAACIRDAFQPTAAPFVSALKRTFKTRAPDTNRDLLQYHILLALRELQKKHLRNAIHALKQASIEGLSAEVRALACELLTTLGVEVKAAREKKTGLEEVRFNPVDGSELVLVPAGSFKAGSEQFKDNPPRDMEIPSFYLARNLVTNAQYRKYLDANPRARKPAYWDNDRYNQPKQPVVGVSTGEAEDYCAWARCRLPTEWEWEKGARGTDGRRYPWGSQKPTRELVNFALRVSVTTPVGNYPKGASAYGLMDMAGNVWEWTASIYVVGSNFRTLRGGSFYDEAKFLASAYRISNDSNSRYDNFGFRCARDSWFPNSFTP